MNALILCVATAALGVDVGWQRLPEGGMEYIIQLDPQTLEILRGEPIQSDIPPGAGKIHSYRIVVGTQKLPRDLPPVESNATEKPPEPIVSDPKGAQLEMPQALPSNPSGKPFPEHPAIYVQPKDDSPAEKPPPKAATDDETGKPGKPWLPLTFTVLGLVASLSANMYLGWIVVDLRRRWRTIQRQETLIETDRR